jgi:signal transduction histidine kinase
MNLKTYRYPGVTQPIQKDKHDTGEELLTRLIHRMARSTGAFRSTTQALLNGADEDPVLRRELLHDMEFELGELQRLIENVTQFRALERGTLILTPRDVLIAPWLRQVTSRWQRIRPEKGLSWAIDIPDGLPVIRVDADKLELGLNNLLGNSVKHSPAGAQVAVRAWAAEGFFHVRVFTSPSHLRPDDYDRLCELFYTGEVQGRFPTGLGLGLYVTRRLLEQQGGSLEILRPAVGSDAVGFEFVVPSADSGPAKEEVRAYSGARKDGALQRTEQGGRAHSA